MSQLCVCANQCFQSCQCVADFSDSWCFSAPARRWMRAMAGAQGSIGSGRGAGEGAEVTGGNWCDDHVWPSCPLLPPAPPPPPPPHVPQTWNTPLHHNHAPLASVANAWNRTDSGAQWCHHAATISRVTKGVEWVSGGEGPLLCCRQTVRSEITFTLQDILILYEAWNAPQPRGCQTVIQLQGHLGTWVCFKLLVSCFEWVSYFELQQDASDNGLSETEQISKLFCRW